MRNSRFFAFLLFSLFILSALTLSFPRAHARTAVAPLDLAGELHGAPYRIRVPEPWNGTLLVYVHGYRDKADHPGELDNRNADIAPSAAVETALLAQGYALAGSASKENGWAIDDAMEDTKDLAVFFRANVARPDRTILWAFSLGTFAAFKSLEQFGGIYDGALCSCAGGSGATRIWDNGVPAILAYDIVFGIPSSWGTVREVRNDIDFETEVAPTLVAQVSNVTNFPKFEFIRLVSGVPGQGINPPPPPNFYPGWVFTDFFFLTEARAELQRRAGGPFVQNVDQNYSLTAAERGLISSGLEYPEQL
jgi:hypothetical protein